MKPISSGRRGVAHLELLDRGAVFGAGRRDDKAVALDRELHRATSLARDRRYAVHRLGKVLAVDLEHLVVVRRDHAIVIGEGAVDQLARSARPRRPRRESCVSLEPDLHLVLAFVDAACAARCTVLRGMITPGIAGSAFGQHHLHPRQPVPVGGDGADHRHLVGLGRMEVDAVQVIPGLFGRDRESGAVDQPAELGRRQRKIVRQLAACHQRIILGRQTGEGKGRSAGAQNHGAAFAAGLDLDLGALAQLADDVVERMRRRGGPALPLDLALERARRIRGPYRSRSARAWPARRAAGRSTG